LASPEQFAAPGTVLEIRDETWLESRLWLEATIRR
jgi:hypothetical protein